MWQASSACLLMCNLFDKVARILRHCGVPWTAARIRFVRVYCMVRHLRQDHMCCAMSKPAGVHRFTSGLSTPAVIGSGGGPAKKNRFQRLDSKWGPSYCAGWHRPYFSCRIDLLSFTQNGSPLHPCTEWGHRTSTRGTGLNFDRSFGLCQLVAIGGMQCSLALAFCHCCPPIMLPGQQPRFNTYQYPPIPKAHRV
jgi:hypothetical protein